MYDIGSNEPGKTIMARNYYIFFLTPYNKEIPHECVGHDSGQEFQCESDTTIAVNIM